MERSSSLGSQKPNYNPDDCCNARRSLCTSASTAGSGMRPREIKDFCRVVSKASHDGLLSKQQAKTLIGQAKSGKLNEAMRGVETIMGR